MTADEKNRAKDNSPVNAYQLHDTLSHLLRRSHFHAEALFTKELGDYGITSRQLAILVAAAQNPGTSQRTIGDLVALDMNTISDLLRRMEKNRLIERRVSASDARAVDIRISAMGKAILSSIYKDNNRYQDALVENLSARETTQLKTLLRKLLDL